MNKTRAFFEDFMEKSEYRLPDLLESEDIEMRLNTKKRVGQYESISNSQSYRHPGNE